MILIETSVTDLAAGYRAIREFVASLESTWLPGFDRSYRRRQEEYGRAIEKHEERGLFLRTLLKTPKPPNRPPPGFKEEVTARLRDEWIDSFRAKRPSQDSELLDLLIEIMDGGFYGILRLQLRANLTAPAIVLGPSGLFLFVEAAEPQGLSQASAEQMWQQVAVEISELLQQADFSGALADAPIKGGIFIAQQGGQSIQERELSSTILAGGADYWRSWLLEQITQSALSPETILSMADALLARHQEVNQEHTFSALNSAEKLTKREKDNLLRMAATL